MTGVAKFAACAAITLSLTACTGGPSTPEQALSFVHLVKDKSYKERPGWAALMELGNYDCQMYKNSRESFFNFTWAYSSCDANAVIEAINTRPDWIPIFYAAYHEYGGVNMGTMDMPDHKEHMRIAILGLAAKLAQFLKAGSWHDSLYENYKYDSWNMGLKDVGKHKFIESLEHFSLRQAEFEQKTNELDVVYWEQKKAADEAELKREQDELMASERPISLTLWANPTPEQKIIANAINTIHFSAKGNGRMYVNGRVFLPTTALSDFRLSLDYTINECSEIGTYTNEKSIRRECVQQLAKDIVAWGKTASDRAITDTAWACAAEESFPRYNALDYQILYSHWAGMARVYSSRGIENCDSYRR